MYRRSLLCLTAFFFCATSRAQVNLPPVEPVAPGVYSMGFAHKQRSVNTGWIALKDRTLLIDIPPGIRGRAYLDAVRASGVPEPFTLVLTHCTEALLQPVTELLEAGVDRILCSEEVRAMLTPLPAKALSPITEPIDIGDAGQPVQFMPFAGVLPQGAAAVYASEQRVLFSGPLISNGPRTVLTGSDSRAWLEALRSLDSFPADPVVPGFGSRGGSGVLHRQIRFLTELRRQVAHFVAMGRPAVQLSTLHLPADYLVWMPYDQPVEADWAHVYSEMTVPHAPYGLTAPGSNPEALVLIGDTPHEPGHLEEGLRAMFEGTGIRPYFAVDVRALSAENLKRVPLLVILRDGLHSPQTGPGSETRWMTREQEEAVVSFVEHGGGFLCLHNSLGLYPDGGPYLQLAGGRYAGHGPLERFSVEVVDADHPVTRGVSTFQVTDEQHTPPYDEDRCHLLLRNRSPDGSVVSAAGWVREQGEGRVCYLANGHTREALAHPMVQRLMRNALHWLLPNEVDR